MGCYEQPAITAITPVMAAPITLTVGSRPRPRQRPALRSVRRCACCLMTATKSHSAIRNPDPRAARQASRPSLNVALDTTASPHGEAAGTHRHRERPLSVTPERDKIITPLPSAFGGVSSFVRYRHRRQSLFEAANDQTDRTRSLSTCCNLPVRRPYTHKYKQVLNTRHHDNRVQWIYAVHKQAFARVTAQRMTSFQMNRRALPASP